MYEKINKFIESKISQSSLKKRIKIVEKNPEKIAESIIEDNPVLAEVSKQFKKVPKVKKESSEPFIYKEMPTKLEKKKRDVIWLT